METILDFNNIQDQLFGLYKISDDRRDYKAIDQAIRSNPSKAKNLLGNQPLAAYHNSRKNRNNLAHTLKLMTRDTEVAPPVEVVEVAPPVEVVEVAPPVEVASVIEVTEGQSEWVFPFAELVPDSEWEQDVEKIQHATEVVEITDPEQLRVNDELRQKIAALEKARVERIQEKAIQAQIAETKARIRAEKIKTLKMQIQMLGSMEGGQ